MRRLAAAVALALLAACGGGSDDTTDISATQDAQPGLSPRAGAPQLPTDAGHIHGMGFDETSGTLYLGTHHGAFAVTEDAVEPVGTARSDFMGFTFAGPDHFLASGHPGEGDDLPNPLGLIESRDGGQTWRPISRQGESDFHTLATGGGLIVGYDGALRVSDDLGRTWRDGPDVQPATVAVDPIGKVVLATTQQGLQRSTDAGRTFTLVDGAPLMVLVAASAGRTLWGATPEGAIHASTDGGATWQSRGDVGTAPHALAGSDSQVFVATDAGIVRSRDGEAFEPFAVG